MMRPLDALPPGPQSERGSAAGAPQQYARLMRRQQLVYLGIRRETTFNVSARSFHLARDSSEQVSWHPSANSHCNTDSRSNDKNTRDKIQPSMNDGETKSADSTGPGTSSGRDDGTSSTVNPWVQFYLDSTEAATREFRQSVPLSRSDHTALAPVVDQNAGNSRSLPSSSKTPASRVGLGDGDSDAGATVKAPTAPGRNRVTTVAVVPHGVISQLGSTFSLLARPPPPNSSAAAPAASANTSTNTVLSRSAFWSAGAPPPPPSHLDPARTRTLPLSATAQALLRQPHSPSPSPWPSPSYYSSYLHYPAPIHLYHHLPSSSSTPTMYHHHQPYYQQSQPHPQPQYQHPQYHPGAQVHHVPSSGHYAAVHPGHHAAHHPPQSHPVAHPQYPHPSQLHSPIYYPTTPSPPLAPAPLLAVPSTPPPAHHSQPSHAHQPTWPATAPLPDPNTAPVGAPAPLNPTNYLLSLASISLAVLQPFLFYQATGTSPGAPHRGGPSSSSAALVPKAITSVLITLFISCVMIPAFLTATAIAWARSGKQRALHDMREVVLVVHSRWMGDDLRHITRPLAQGLTLLGNVIEHAPSLTLHPQTLAAAALQGVPMAAALRDQVLDRVLRVTGGSGVPNVAVLVRYLSPLVPRQALGAVVAAVLSAGRGPTTEAPVPVVGEHGAAMHEVTEKSPRTHRKSKTSGESSKSSKSTASPRKRKSGTKSSSGSSRASDSGKVDR